MADSRHLNRVDPVELSDDDPFAELVNIMGFDPRVQVKRAAEPKDEAIATSEESLDPSHDDLTMDLEKELVTEPALEEGGAFTLHSEPAEMPAPAVRVAESDAVAQTHAVEFPDPEPLLSDADFDAAFESGLAADDGDMPAAFADEQPVGQPAFADEQPAGQDIFMDEQPADQTAFADEQPAAQPAFTDERPAAQLIAATDDAAFPDAPEAPDMRDESDEALELVQDVVAQPDLAMAEVDMNFERNPADEQPAFQTRSRVEKLEAGHVPYDRGEIDFDAPEMLEDAEPQSFYVEADMAQVHPADAGAVQERPAEDERRELSLEDELNALLGNPAPSASPSMGEEISPVEAVSPEATGLEFDEYAFDAAFTAGLVENVAGTPAPRDEAPEQSAADAPIEDALSSTAAYDDFPDVDTVDVPERAVAVADDLDIPDVAYEEEVRPVPVLDEFEKEFAAVFAEPAQPEAPVAEAEIAVDNTGYDEPVATADGAEAAASGDDDFGMARNFDVDSLSDPRISAGQESDSFEVDEYKGRVDEYKGMDVEDVPPPPYAELHRAPKRRIPAIALLVGGVAILGGIGALALSFGGGGSDAPVVVKADENPIKVKPENPGGTTVPNQDSTVYDSVAGAGGVNEPAQQESLITSAEEPVDMAAQVAPPEEMSGVDDTEALDSTEAAGSDDEIAAIVTKDEDRIAPSLTPEQAAVPPAEEEPAAVTPTRVRTLIVRADGTMVPREEPVADNASTASASSAPVSSATPDTVPVAPSRPADQPVNVVAAIGRSEQVASVAPTAAQPAGEWFMQIASQPNEESAKSTLEALSRKYSSVLGGHNATIVKAEIAGKGTFWRIRVPAGTREDAIGLCENYKTAGGSCFVTK